MIAEIKQNYILVSYVYMQRHIYYMECAQMLNLDLNFLPVFAHYGGFVEKVERIYKYGIVTLILKG